MNINKVTLRASQCQRFIVDFMLISVNPAFLVKGLEGPDVAISRRQIVQQVFSALLARLGENIRVGAQPSNEACRGKLGKRWRVEVQHCAMSMVLDLPEHGVARLLPMIVNVV